MEIIEAYLTHNPCYQANVREEDSRYTAFQTEGPRGLMLHSVGCAQPKASVFLSGWDKPDYDRACVHAFIDGKTGTVYQTLPWSFRGWHCGGPANETHVGAILARRGGAAAGLASDHGDPEHYWSGLGTGHTMDGFRADVAAAMTEISPAAPDLGTGTEPSDPAEPGAAGEALPFPDVPAEAWYADALRWAVEKRIVLPGDAPFRPDAPLTKAAAVVWLRRLWRSRRWTVGRTCMA